MMWKYLVLLAAHLLKYVIVGLISYLLPHFLPLFAACCSLRKLFALPVPDLLFAATCMLSMI